MGWVDYIGVICQNVSAVPVAPVVTFVNRKTGETSIFTDTTPIAPFASHGYNTRYGGNQEATWFGDPNDGSSGNNLAGDFLGSVHVSGADDLACVQETWAERIYDFGTSVWVEGADANINNLYGK
jgi:hypothetical protein